MAIQRGYVLLDHTPVGATQLLMQQAGEILVRGRDAQGNVVESYFAREPNDPAKWRQVVLMADSTYDLDQFFGNMFDKSACFKKAADLVQKNAAANNLLQPVTPDEYLKNLPDFAVIALK